MLNKTILPFFGKEAINWYSESKYWPVILVIVNTWKGVGYGCLIYISSISGIDPSFYEAAELDGASKWKQIRYITLPSIMPSVITLTLLNIGRIFYSDFGLFYQVTQNSGQLYDTTNVINTYVYGALLQCRKYRNGFSGRLLSVHCRICLCTAGKCGCAQIKP